MAAKPAANSRRAKAAYAPGKLGAATRVGLHPRIAVAVAGGVLALGLVATLATGHRLQDFFATVGVGVDRELAGLGFKVERLEVQGASPMAAGDIRRAAGLYKDQPILGLDLESVRERVAKVGWVKEVRVVRLLPDTIALVVVGREPMAVWQHGGAAHLVDAEGRLILEADPSRFPDLPLVVGDGADQAAATVLPIVRARPRLMERMEALVRVDDRRWDLRMKDGSLIQLPAVGEDSALIQLDQLERQSQILELGFARIDLRNPELVAVRPKDPAPPGQLVANGA